MNTRQENLHVIQSTTACKVSVLVVTGVYSIEGKGLMPPGTSWSKGGVTFASFSPSLVFSLIFKVMF